MKNLTEADEQKSCCLEKMQVVIYVLMQMQAVQGCHDARISLVSKNYLFRYKEKKDIF